MVFFNLRWEGLMFKLGWIDVEVNEYIIIFKGKKKKGIYIY